MRGLIKLIVAAGLMTFTAYTFYVEPNASQDPIGAISKASERLTTFCDRNQEECTFLGDLGDGIGQATSIGWKIVTGQGRLVYVPYDGRSYDASARNSGSSLGDLVRSTTLFGGNSASDSRHEDCGQLGGSRSGERYSHYCN